MRIGWVLHGLGVCGGVRVVLEYANNMFSMGHDVEVIVPAPQPEWFPLEAPIRPRPKGTYDALIATYYATAPQVVKYPDAQCKYYFIQMLEHEFFTNDRLKRSVLNTHDKRLKPVVISPQLKEELSVLYDDIEVVFNGVNTDMFYPDAAKRDAVLIEGHSLNPAKDIDFLAWKVAKYLKEEYDIKIMGFSQYTPSRYASEVSDMYFTAPPTDRLRWLYSSALFLLKASRLEGSALAPIEAMACGTTCARAIEWGDPLLKDGENCLLVEYSEEQLREAAVKLVEQTELRSKLEKNAEDFTHSDEMSWKHKAHEWIDIIRTDLDRLDQ